jgi:hypothetical protein
MECNGMNKYVQFCLCMNDSILGLKRKYGNSYGILLLMSFFYDDVYTQPKLQIDLQRQLIKINKESQKT